MADILRRRMALDQHGHANAFGYWGWILEAPTIAVSAERATQSEAFMVQRVLVP